MDNNLTVIGIFGNVNSGKSTLFNILLNQDYAIVSATAGTTTDCISKNIELGELGKVKLIDTAGFGDYSALGKQRISGTISVADTVDIAIIIRVAVNDGSDEIKKRFDELNTPYIEVINTAKTSELSGYNNDTLLINFEKKEDINVLLKALLTIKTENTETLTITGDLVSDGDTVILVMPQDKSAPNGRLILPQSQTIRELLDKNCIVIAITPIILKETLEKLNYMPNLIITDSSVFDYVYNIVPKECKLTSFSVLFAKFKGDIVKFIEGAKAFDILPKDGKILILEACSHTPKGEDIGRVKLPNMIRNAYGDGIEIVIANGSKIPNNLAQFNLIIHCGACMFTRKSVLNRIYQAEKCGVPITNYGIAIAKLNGILDKIVF